MTIHELRGTPAELVRQLAREIGQTNAHAAEISDRQLALQVVITRVLVPVLVREGLIDAGEWNASLEDLAQAEEGGVDELPESEWPRLRRVIGSIRECKLEGAEAVTVSLRRAAD